MFNSQFASKLRLAGNNICIKIQKCRDEKLLKQKIHAWRKTRKIVQMLDQNIEGGVTSCGPSGVISEDAL